MTIGDVVTLPFWKFSQVAARDEFPFLININTLGFMGAIEGCSVDAFVHALIEGVRSDYSVVRVGALLWPVVASMAPLHRFSFRPPEFIVV